MIVIIYLYTYVQPHFSYPKQRKLYASFFYIYLSFPIT